MKFYPYPTEDDDQIFAAAGERDVYVCRIVRDAANAKRPFEVLRCFEDGDHETSLNSLVWTKDPTTHSPLLCVAGSKPTHIKIIDVDTSEPVRTLTGHGKAVNDLAVSPLSSNIIASASEDYTIRLWNLDPKHANQPCVAIFSGDGHKQPILAIDFHPNGRWLLSGGLDTAVCLWPVPSIAELGRKHLSPEQLEQHQDPKVVYYPHFQSTEVHHNYVDSLRFYGDLILSKAARDSNDKNKKNEILLWKIEGFDPDEPPPEDPPIPAPGLYTRSSFPHNARSAGFQRLLSFRIDHTDRFYHRFGLLHQADMRPVLCMGTEQSKFCFWDLQDIEEGKVHTEGKAKKGGKGKKGKASVSEQNLNRLDGLRRAESVASESTAAGTGKSTRKSYQSHHTKHTVHTAMLTHLVSQPSTRPPAPNPPRSPRPPQTANPTSATPSANCLPTTCKSPARTRRPSPSASRSASATSRLPSWRGARTGSGWSPWGIWA